MTLSHSVSAAPSLGIWPPLLTLALHPLPLLSPSLFSFIAGYLFSEPQNPSQASDIYSLESECFLCLLPKARLLREISPGLLPALLEAEGWKQSWAPAAHPALLMSHPIQSVQNPAGLASPSAHIRCINRALELLHHKFNISQQVRGGVGENHTALSPKSVSLPLPSRS